MRLGLFAAACGTCAPHGGAAQPAVSDLVLDDECATGGEDESGCALNALHLRAAKTAQKIEAAGEATPLVETRIGCPRVTAGTCLLFGCNKWRGNTSCIGGSCLCNEGTCANSQGVCVEPGPPACKKDTGSCFLMNCGDGQTCSKNHRCLCNEGLCASHLGTCERPDTCLMSTGGSCRITNCNPDRGPTQCNDRKCECLHGYCAEDRGDGYGVCMLKPHPDFLTEVAAVNQDHPAFPKPHNKVWAGLAFSGGGARALSWAMGGYRALEDLGLMDSVDAISSVSGGTWASSIYMYASNGTEKVLGKATNPEDLTLEVLDADPPAMGKAVTTSDKAFLAKVLTDDYPPDQIWELFIGETILKPFGLHSRTAFLAGSAEEVERIRRDNPQLKDAEFLLPLPNRPKVFVMNGAILAPMGFKSDASNMVGLQMSPDYTGSPYWPDGAAHKTPRGLTYKPATNGGLTDLYNVKQGGGMVQSFAFGGPAPTTGQSGGRTNIPVPPQAFTLTAAVGISSVAPASQLAQLGKMQFVVPQAEVWPVLPKGETQPAMRYQLGDGGNLENSGLLPLLQRRAERVVMWVSTYIPLGKDVDFCAPPGDLDLDELFNGKNEELGLQVAPMVNDKFGYSYDDGLSVYANNQVFERSELLPLLCELQKLKRAGKPTVYASEHKVLRNKWWGIKGGWTVKLLTVYLDQCMDFEKALPAETRAALGPSDPAGRTWETSKQFARYPDFSTTGQTGKTEIISLTSGEVNLLAAQSEYFVRQNEQLFREVLCPPGIYGSCCRDPKAALCSIMPSFK